MSVRLVKGKVKRVWYPVHTSTAFDKDSLVEIASALVDPADDNDTALAGVIDKAIASTDSDYATSRSVGILVPMERHTVWEIDTGGSFAAGTDEGLEFGISDSGTLDHSDTTNKVFLVTQVLSATKVRGYLKINGSY